MEERQPVITVTLGCFTFLMVRFVNWKSRYYEPEIYATLKKGNWVKHNKDISRHGKHVKGADNVFRKQTLESLTPSMNPWALFSKSIGEEPILGNAYVYCHCRLRAIWLSSSE